VVPEGTNVTVITRGLIEKMEAPPDGVTRICCARVIIVTGQQARGDTITLVAVVAQGAGITIVTGTIHGVMVTGPCFTTQVSGTIVTIIAKDDGPGSTQSVDASIVDGARVPVVTGTCNCVVDASQLLIANVLRAGVEIITINDLTAHATAFDTPIILSALITVIAESGSRCEDASTSRFTRVAGAEVAIVAYLLLPRHTLAFRAEITNRAGITVLAGRLI